MVRDFDSNSFFVFHVYFEFVARHVVIFSALYNKFQTGLKKLFETYDVVDSMKGELDVLEPKLIKKSAETEELMKKLATDQKEADEVNTGVFIVMLTVYFVGR